MLPNVLRKSDTYEQERLATLRQLNLLDTPASESFDRITRMASQLFQLPIAAVSLTDDDRQWFKSRVGVDHREIPRFKACCGEVADTSKVLVIRDLLTSPYYQNSVLADSGIRFYAGAPLTTRDGYTLGAMCVLGNEPREVTEQEMTILQDLADMVMAQIELQHAFGRLDPLTGLPNRSQFIEDIQDQAHDDQDGQRYVFYTDLFDSSQIRSLQRVMGPSSLDEASRQVATQLQNHLGKGSRLYQIGDCQYAHFVCAADDTAALHTATQLTDFIKTLTLNDSAPLMLQPAIGIAPFSLCDQAPTDILRLAHSASQDAREAEMSVGMYSHERDIKHQRRFSLIAEFRKALQAGDQLHLVYQPRVAMDSGQCVSVEALIRWQHPELGTVSPVEFIPLIEKTPLARALTEWVISSAVKQALDWKQQGFALSVSVNVAASNLEEDDFVDRLIQTISDNGLEHSDIELELTENTLVSNGRAVWTQLDRLNSSGFTVAIDDFGTGYSSLAYLKDIPAQVVKIDRSFIFDVEKVGKRRSLVNSMISMAQDLGYRVVAEGVETEAAYHTLKELGCDEVQGYWLSRPLSAQVCGEWMTQRSVH